MAGCAPTGFGGAVVATGTVVDVGTTDAPADDDEVDDDEVDDAGDVEDRVVDDPVPDDASSRGDDEHAARSTTTSPATVNSRHLQSPSCTG